MKLRKMLAAFLSGCMLLAAMPISSASAAGDRVSVHDPSIIKAEGTYYVFGSHIEAAKSSDLRNWKSFANGYASTNNVEFGNLSQNLKKAFDWAGEDLEDCEGGFAVWAPDVVWNPDYINSDGSRGAYLMYFCTSSTYMRSVIAYAAAKNIEGPYTFVDTLIYSGFTNNDSYATSATKRVNRKYTSTNIDELMASGEVEFNSGWFRNDGYNNQLYPNAIDPTIYYDTDGKMYMCYGSWSGGIFTLEIDPATGRCIHPKTGQTSDGRMIDSYFGTKISGGYGKSGEGPFIEYNSDTGYYYLWVTYGGLFSTGGYNMRVFRSKSPTGPFTDPAGRQAVLPSNPDLDSVGLKVMGNYKFSCLKTAYMACGHNSVLRDDDGNWYLFYHARFDDNSEYHEVRVHSMYFNEDGWPVVAPFEYSGDVISSSGYDESDIIGDYEFINHGNATDGKIIGYSNITLNADHTISGAASGSWSQAPDCSAASITIGNQTYSGYFLAALDESGKKVMSFTAVGSNNQTIWGAQTKLYSGTDRGGTADFTDSDSLLIHKSDSVSGTGKELRLSDTELLSGVSYYIINKNSGKAVDIPNGKLDEGINIQQWEHNRSWAQQWRIISEEDGYCRIVSIGDESMCIAVAESSGDDGVNIELQRYSGADNQLFRIVKSGSDYGIVSKCSGGTAGLDVYEWSTENGGNINQWNYWEGDCQLWKITPVHPYVNSGTYQIRSASSGLYLTGSSDKPASGAQPQTWVINELGEGFYSISDRSGNMLIPGEKLRLICNRDGSYSILSGDSDCIGVSGNDVVTSEFTGGGSQSFVLEPVQLKELPGDVNADGDVNVADLVMLQSYLLGKTRTLTDNSAADLNGNGIIDVFDNVRLRKILLKKYQ